MTYTIILCGQNPHVEVITSIRVTDGNGLAQFESSKLFSRVVDLINKDGGTYEGLLKNTKKKAT